MGYVLVYVNTQHIRDQVPSYLRNFCYLVLNKLKRPSKIAIFLVKYGLGMLVYYVKQFYGK